MKKFLWRLKCCVHNKFMSFSDFILVKLCFVLVSLIVALFVPMLPNKKRILSVKQLKKLTDHTYSCTNASILDPWLQPWWNFLVSKTPLWLAPNLITIIGLAINIVTTLILVAYCPNAVTAPPRWACFLCALGLFIYQSLDSIDGKQARRTNTSTPLGELFDHGCDAISTVFVALSACLSCQLGHYPNWLFFQCFCAISLFYCAHWQTYVSGTLRFGKVDVTEAQLTIIAIHLVSAIFGSEIWMVKIFGIIELWSSLSLLTIFGGFWSISRIYTALLAGGVGKNGSTVAVPILDTLYQYIILMGVTIGYAINFTSFCKIFLQCGIGKNGSTVALTYLGGYEVRTIPLYFAFAIDTLLAIRYAKVITSDGCGKNGSTVAGTSVLSPSIPLSMVILPAFIIAQKSPDNIFVNYASLYIISFGMVAAKITNKLVIAHMTKAELEYLDWSLLGPGILFLNQYFNCVVPEVWLLWFTLVWTIQDLARYCAQVCLEICAHLHIELFSIPYSPKARNQSISAANTPNDVVGAAGVDKTGATSNRKLMRQTNKSIHHK